MTQDETDAAARLAEALQRAPGMTVIWPGSTKIAAALLPVVRELQAEALEAAATDIRRTTTLGHIADRLERRAATLRGEAGR